MLIWCSAAFFSTGIKSTIEAREMKKKKSIYFRSFFCCSLESSNITHSIHTRGFMPYTRDYINSVFVYDCWMKKRANYSSLLILHTEACCAVYSPCDSPTLVLDTQQQPFLFHAAHILCKSTYTGENFLDRVSLHSWTFFPSVLLTVFFFFVNSTCAALLDSFRDDCRFWYIMVAPPTGTNPAHIKKMKLFTVHIRWRHATIFLVISCLAFCRGIQLILIPVSYRNRLSSCSIIFIAWLLHGKWKIYLLFCDSDWYLQANFTHRKSWSSF